MQTVGIAGCPVRALRVTYMGELGWELHLPVEYATSVFDTVTAAGAAHGLTNAGYRAIESCRLEKGYRAWGSDIGPDHTPLEAGLGWAVKTKTDIEFRGRAAIEAQRAGGMRKMLAASRSTRSGAARSRDHLPRRCARRWLTSAGFGYTSNGRSVRLVRNPDGVTPPWVLEDATSWRSAPRGAGSGVDAAALRPDEGGPSVKARL